MRNTVAAVSEQGRCPNFERRETYQVQDGKPEKAPYFQSPMEMFLAMARKGNNGNAVQRCRREPTQPPPLLSWGGVRSRA